MDQRERRRRRAQAEEERAKGTPGVSQKQERELALLSVDTLERGRREKEFQLDFVEELMIECSPVDTIARMGRERWTQLTKQRVRELVKEVETKWMEESSNVKDTHRLAMIERLHRARRQALGRNPPNIGLVLKCESQIATLEGLQAPKQIEHSGRIQHAQALAAVIANLEPEQVEEMLAGQREKERLADLALTMLPSTALAATGTDDDDPDPEK